jgi:hypothetical protein
MITPRKSGEERERWTERHGYGGRAEVLEIV